MLPKDAFLYIKSKIGQISLISFFSALIFGLLIHGFRISNTLLIWDSVFNFHDPQNTIYLGRWFLTLACGISSYYDLQWINGILSILYLSICSALICKLLNLSSAIPALLLSLLMVSFPTVASTFSYMYTADGYFLGLLLMVIGLYLACFIPKGWIWGSILLAFGLGCYQAYLGFIITLIIIIALNKLLSPDFNPSSFFKYIGKLLAFGIMGLLLYGIINHFLLVVERVSLADYNGISGIAFSLSTIPNAIKYSFIDFVYFFFGPIKNLGLYQILNLLLFIFIGVIFIISFIRLFREKSQYLALILALSITCLLLLPIGCGIIYFISPHVRYYMLMNECYLSLYLFPIMLWDKTLKKMASMQWTCLLLSLLTVFNFAISSNIAYTMLEANNQSTYFMLNRLVDRIEKLPEYNNLKYICVLGHIPDYDKIESSIPPTFSGIRHTYFIDNEKHFSAILRDRFGLNLEAHSLDEHLLFETGTTSAPAGIWPADDSIMVSGNTLIIRMGD